MTTPNAVSKYDVGDLVTLRATIVSTDGVTLADPSVMTFYVKNPAGSVASYVYGSASVARAGAGAYFVDVTVSSAGDWYYRAEATGYVQAAEEWRLIVGASFVL